VFNNVLSLLQDRNDNTPQFAENPFTTNVFENITEGDVVITVSSINLYKLILLC